MHRLSVGQSGNAGHQPKQIVVCLSVRCAADPMLGSHGMSAVVDPRGAVVAEATVFSEELITARIDLPSATAAYAAKSLLPAYALSDWWRSGLDYVEVHS